MNEKKQISIIILGLCVFGFLLYANTLKHSFHFDDFIFIVNNPEITDISNIKQIWNEGSAPTRFIGYLSFALNYHVHQFDVAGYHLFNIAVHILNSVLVFWLTLLLLKTPRMQEDELNRKRVILSGMAAAFFLIHPIQTQAVTYICQRFASLATLFYLLTVCFYVKGRCVKQTVPVYFTLAFLSAVTGMFTKQIVLTLPLMILMVEGCFFDTFKRKENLLAGNWRWGVVFLMFLMIIPAVYSFDIRTIIFREFESLSHRGETLNSPRYFLTQFRVVWTYIRLLIFPVHQNLLYDFPASRHLFEIKTLAGFFGIISLIAFTWRYRRRNILMTFGISWFFIALLVESSIIPIRQVIFEHRCYLPFYGFALFISAGMVRTIRRPKYLWAVAVTLLCVLSALTYQRNKVWTNDITLWGDVLKKSPKMIRPYTHLATAHLNAKQFEKALDIYTRGIAVDPQRAESYNNRGNVYVALKQYDHALRDYLKALSMDDSLVKTYNNIGIIYNRKRDFGQALKYYAKAVNLDERNSGAYFNRANVYLQLNRLEEAFADYSKAIEYNPFHKKALYYRSQIYALNKDYKFALDDILNAQALGLKVDQTYIRDLKGKLNER